MNIQKVDEEIRKLNARWTGKTVLVIGNHPHKGEQAEVIGFEYLPDINNISMKVSGDNMDFYIHDSKMIREINYGE